MLFSPGPWRRRRRPSGLPPGPHRLPERPVARLPLEAPAHQPELVLPVVRIPALVAQVVGDRCPDVGPLRGDAEAVSDVLGLLSLAHAPAIALAAGREAELGQPDP